MTCYFDCRRWFSREDDDGLIERDLLPDHHRVADDTPDMHYTAEVFTSDVRAAGTDADVSLELFGQLGSSGPQNLNVRSRAALLSHMRMRLATTCQDQTSCSAMP